jgi:hypothetical protein
MLKSYLTWRNLDNWVLIVGNPSEAITKLISLSVQWESNNQKMTTHRLVDIVGPFLIANSVVDHVSQICVDIMNTLIYRGNPNNVVVIAISSPRTDFRASASSIAIDAPRLCPITATFFTPLSLSPLLTVSITRSAVRSNAALNPS